MPQAQASDGALIPTGNGVLLVVQDIGWVNLAARPYKAQMSGARIIGACILPPAAMVNLAARP